MATGISIHAAREGGDQARSRIVCLPKAFQSTPPVKAATFRNNSIAHVTGISIHAAREGGDDGLDPAPIIHYISIHAAREGGDDGLDPAPIIHYISIHAAREGGDGRAEIKIDADKAFQSTPPVKAATTFFLPISVLEKISIHAAREGGDSGGQRRTFTRQHFNPRRP